MVQPSYLTEGTCEGIVGCFDYLCFPGGYPGAVAGKPGPAGAAGPDGPPGPAGPSASTAYVSSNSRVRQNNFQAVSPGNVAATVVFDTVDYDDDGVGGTRMSPVGIYTNTGADAVHVINAAVSFNINVAAMQVYLTLRVNGTSVARSGGYFTSNDGSNLCTMNVRATLNVLAGQTVDVQIVTDNVTDVEIQSNPSTYLEVRTVGTL